LLGASLNFFSSPGKRNKSRRRPLKKTNRKVEVEVQDEAEQE
jgi:hypothetical protein